MSAGEVVAAAQARARALAAGDRAALTRLLHPQFRWTTHRGAVLDRAAYLEANTGSGLAWVSQQLDDVDVQVVDDRVAVLTAWVTDVVARDGPERTFRMRLTQTWVRTWDGWVCLAGHAGPTSVAADA
ncbi:MAG TPA: nuclear transport factor 2 family protein [Actinoplanes sp.]|nr:nuclear transport factor 2 family protein [Actinoplanes sp.]